MSSESWFLIFVFAVFRLSELLSRDLIFEPLRRSVGRKAAEGSRVWVKLGEWIICPLCVGVWFSIPASIVYSIAFLRSTDVLQMLVLWLGMAGAQYMLSKISISLDDN